MSYLISAWPADQGAGPVKQVRRATFTGAEVILYHWKRYPPDNVVRVSIFDEIGGQVVTSQSVKPENDPPVIHRWPGSIGG